MFKTSSETIDWKTYWRTYLSRPDVALRYFYLHLTGIGYITRVQEKVSKEGEAMLFADLVGLYGPFDQLKYTPMNVMVSGAEAQKLIRQCRRSVDAQAKVLIAFRVGEPYVSQFVYGFGPRMGQHSARLQGQLLSIGWIKIDGKLVYNVASDEAWEFNVPAQSLDATSKP